MVKTNTTFKFNKNIIINKSSKYFGNHNCAYCLEPIGTGQYSLSLHRVTGETKDVTPSYHSGNNIRIHITCIDEFANSIIKLKEENLQAIFALSLGSKQ